MRWFLMGLLILGLAAAGCAGGDTESTGDTAQTDSGHEEAAVDETALLNKEDPAGTYGEGVHLAETVSIATLLDDPAPYEGKKVLVEGTISEVCPMRGCWVDITGEASTIRVKVVDGEIVFPLSAKGHEARIEGVVEKLELEEADARAWKKHEADEKGEEFDPASVTGPMTIWRIKGSGAEIEG
jgi:hypothetical protein